MCKECIGLIDKIVKADDDNLKKELKKKGYADPQFTVDQIGILEEELSDILFKYQDDVLGLMNDYDSMETLITGIKIGSLTNELTPIFKEIFTSTLEKLVESYLQNVDKDLVFSQFCSGTTDWISKWSGDLAELIDISNQETLENIFNNALEAGDSVQDVARALEEAYLFSPARARRIALTEMLSAHSYARFDATMQNPIITKITWKHSGSKGINAREAHMALDGTTIVKGEHFDVNGHKALFPRDTNLPASERVNCHCTFNEEVDEEVIGLSKEEKQKLQEEAIKEADKLYSW